MSCTNTLPSATLQDGTLDVVDKFKILTEAALDTDSIYMRAKDTFKELFDGRKVSEVEYAGLASSFISQLAVATTQQVMQGALLWAEKEKTLAFSLAETKANTELALANAEMIAHQICQLDKETDLACAKIEATISGSIRDNGRVLTYDATGCKPISLYDEGMKFEQTAVYEAQTYTALADAYRKSGVVTIAETADGIDKGVSGDNFGYTDAQEEYARRQIKSFEDSKRNHAANAMSQMIGQMLSAEIPPAAEDIARWRTAIDYLSTNTP